MSKLVLLTRDCGNCEFTKDELNKKNITTFTQPISTISYLDIEDLGSLVSGSYLIITSFHALKPFLDNYDELKKVKNIFVVGEKSRNFLQENNLPYHMFPSASSLLDFVKSKYRGVKDKFVYIRGHEVSVDFKMELESNGNLYFESIIYEVNYITQLSQECINEIANYKITDHISFSKVNALQLIHLLKKSKVLEQAKSIKIHGLSERIAKVFIKEGFTNVDYAEMPIFDDVLEICLASL